MHPLFTLKVRFATEPFGTPKTGLALYDRIVIVRSDCIRVTSQEAGILVPS